jgi:signal peptidase II
VKKTQRLILVALIILLGLLADIGTKKIAQQSLRGAPPISWLGNTVLIEYHENLGAFLGLGADLSREVRFLFLVVFVGLVLSATLFYAINSQELGLPPLIGLSLVGAGGLGNLIDRIFNNGAAVDFMQVGIGPLRTGIFNVADLEIMGGIALFIIFNLLRKGEKS